MLHTSGSQAARVLEPLASQGSAIGTLHPLKAFPDILPDPALAAGSVFAFEGDPEARRLACRLVGAWSALIADVPAESRPLYHLAASVAAGGVVTLVATAWEIAHRLGLPDTIGRGYLELAQGALDRVADAENPAAAITGPVARGDVEMLKDQLRRLESLEPEWSHLVASVARETLRQIEKRDGPRASLEELRRLLETVN